MKIKLDSFQVNYVIGNQRHTHLKRVVNFAYFRKNFRSQRTLYATDYKEKDNILMLALRKPCNDARHAF